MRMLFVSAVFSLSLISATGRGGEDRVEADIAVLDNELSVLAKEREPETFPLDTAWVARHLSDLVKTDQRMRAAANIPFERRYDDAERKHFWKLYSPRFAAVDGVNTAEIRLLLGLHDWFSVGRFGEQADRDGWLLVQHADRDLPLQKMVLGRLERLHKVGDTAPRHYAYLSDRVAIAEQRPQWYGTQGRCTGPGAWEPFALENAEQVDARRAALGMESLQDYRARFEEICKEG